jgi:hypothetical protein
MPTVNVVIIVCDVVVDLSRHVISTVTRNLRILRI